MKQNLPLGLGEVGEFRSKNCFSVWERFGHFEAEIHRVRSLWSISGESLPGGKEHGTGQPAEEPGRVEVRIPAACAAEGAAADPTQAGPGEGQHPNTHLKGAVDQILVADLQLCKIN